MKEYRLWGPPGTGKTTRIVEKATLAADRKGEDQVSICSLTNAAVRETISRDIPISAENMTTLHARCKRSLDAPPPAEVYISEFLEDHPKYNNDECIPASYRGSRASEDKNERMMAGLGTLYDTAQINRQQMIPEKNWEDRVRIFHEEWSGWCRDRGLMDFTGWLEMAMEADSLPPQYAVFVDEAQDHTPLQLSVLRSWRTDHLILVGDDDQNLYEWSGAIPDKFFTPELPPEREAVLGQSYRLPREVYKMAKYISSKIIKRRAKEYSPKDSDGMVGQSNYRLNDAKLEDPMPGIYKSNNKICMVLTTCSYMLNDIIKSLRDQGIPFHNPYRTSNVRWNPLSTDSSRVAKGYLIGEWTGNVVHNWGKLLDSHKVFKDREGFLSFCADNMDREISPQEIRPFLQDTNAETVLSRSPKTLLELRRKLAIGSWEYYVKVFKEGSDCEPKVIVGTIHSVKGGEADVVHIFPDLSTAGYQELYEKPDRIHRLFYVAVTRSKESVIMHNPSGFKSYAI